MKIHHLPLSFALIAATAGLFSALTVGCSKADRTEVSAKANDAYVDAKDGLKNAWDTVRGATYERRDDFIANSKAVNAKLDAQLSEMHANYSDEKASASRRAAMAELKDSEADYKEKTEALGHATAATWESAKQNVIASWDKLQASYYKARAD